MKTLCRSEKNVPSAAVLVVFITVLLVSCRSTPSEALAPASPAPASSSAPALEITPDPILDSGSTDTSSQTPDMSVNVPSTIVAGRSARIRISFHGVDKDSVEVQVVQVLGLGDQYIGGDYVTSQPLARLGYDQDGISFLADTPGNYRLTITANYENGVIAEEIDVPVIWSPNGNPFAIQGVAIDTWGPPDWNDLAYVPELIEIAHELGANYIQLAPYWHLDSVGGSTIQSCLDLPHIERGCTTPTDDQIRVWTRHAHSLGMEVFLKPHLNIGAFDRELNSFDAESWQLAPSDSALWFSSYRDFILRYARIAQEENVEIFAVGNELSGTEGMYAGWSALIAEIRDVYDGQLTYSMVGLWNNGPLLGMPWDSLDLIGVPYYFMGSESDSAPTIGAMVNFVNSHQQQNLNYTMSQFSNPVLATEMGRPNFDGTNYNPWDWTDRVVDNQEQVDWFEAALTSQLDLGPRFQGVFVWVLKPRREVYKLDWDFRDKPVFEALRLWYSG